MLNLIDKINFTLRYIKETTPSSEINNLIYMFIFFLTIITIITVIHIKKYKKVLKSIETKDINQSDIEKKTKILKKITETDICNFVGLFSIYVVISTCNIVLFVSLLVISSIIIALSNYYIDKKYLTLKFNL